MAALNINPQDFAAWQAQQTAAPSQAPAASTLNIDPNDFNQWLQQQNPSNQGLIGAAKAYGGGLLQGIDTTAADVNYGLQKGLSMIPGLSSLNPNIQPTNALAAAFSPKNLSQPLSFTAAAQANDPNISGLGNMIGQAAATVPAMYVTPVAAAAEALGDAGIGINALANARPIVQSTVSAIPRITDTALQGGSVNTLLNAQNPNVSVGGSFATGAVLGPVIGEALGLAPNIAQSGKNALLGMLGANASRQDAANMVAQGVQNGVNVPLSVAINSPGMQKYQAGILSKVPLGGQAKQINQYVNQIQGQTKNILQGMLGNNEQEDIPTILQTALNTAKTNAQANANQLYNNADQIATANNVQIQPTNYFNTAQQIKNNFDASLANNPELQTLMTGDNQRLYNFVSNLTNTPRPFSGATQAIRPYLNDQISTAYKNGNSNIGNAYSQLKMAFDQDLNNSAVNSGVPELATAFNQAVQNYRENYAPFLEGELDKFTSADADPDKIVPTFVKTGQFDRPTLLKTLTDQLPQEATSALGLAHLLRGSQKTSIAQAEPQLVVNNYNKLGPASKNILFTPEQNQQLTNLTNLLNQSQNLIASAQHSAGLGNEGGLAGLAAIMHPNLVGKVLAPSLALPPLTRALNSNWTRNALLRPMDTSVATKNMLARWATPIIAGGS